ncbi:hypothetical protein [Nocardia salmonicida]|uniref:hypothetical protein n=1 Tax=Nocardia salmonicida TaxID=53431 RepID=UPI0033F7AC8A
MPIPFHLRKRRNADVTPEPVGSITIPTLTGNPLPADFPDYLRSSNTGRSVFAGLTVHDHSADSQDAQRERRRKNLTVVLDDRFVLSAEVSAVLSDLPSQIAAMPSPARWAVPVRDLCEDVHEALSAVAKIAGADAPAWTEPGAESLADGSWVVRLADAARALDAPLRTALERGKTTANGEPVRARLLTLVRDIDRAEINLSTALRAARLSDVAAPAPSSARIARDRMVRRHHDEVAALKALHRAELQGLMRGA